MILNICCEKKIASSTIVCLGLGLSGVSALFYGGYKLINKKSNIEKIETEKNGSDLFIKIKPLIISKFKIENKSDCRYIERLFQTLDRLDSKEIFNFQKEMDHETFQKAALLFYNNVNANNVFDKIKEFYKNQITMFKDKVFVNDIMKRVNTIISTKKDEGIIKKAIDLVSGLSFCDMDQQNLVNEEIMKNTKIQEELIKYNFELTFANLQIYYVTYKILMKLD